MKKIALFLVVVLALSFALTSCGQNTSSGNIMNSTAKEEEFYNLVSETQDLLDEVADDIYSYWYDCIYNDKYLENINYAIAMAMSDNQSSIDTIESNTTRIKELYKGVKDGKLSAECKAVMQAYNDYYELVINVSGSFNSYSANKESYKKELASALSDLSFELN